MSYARNTIRRTQTQHRPLAALLLVALALASTASHADTAAHFGIGATVTPHATLTAVDGRRDRIEITAEDIARGSIEIATMQLEIQHNSADGYVLNVLPLAQFFTSAEIIGLDSAVSFGRDGASIVQRGHGGAEHVAMSYRFVLARDLAPGTYPWPVHLTVNAL